MAANSFSSNSGDSIIIKVVADYSYFKQLQEAEKQQNKKFAQRRQQLEQELYPAEQSGSSEQVGSGSNQKRSHRKVFAQKRKHVPDSNNSEEKRLRQVIREELKLYFDKPPPTFLDYVKSIKISDVLKAVPFLRQLVGGGSQEQVGQDQEQVGEGTVDRDILPPPHDEHDDKNFHTKDTGAFVKELGSYEPRFNTDDFLRLAPSTYKARAKKLLMYFRQNPMRINWNEDGVVTIDGEQIPGSNMRDIFRQLFSIKPDFNMPGYVSVTSALLDAGLGHLFRKKSFWFTCRRQNFKPVAFQDANQSSNWFFINFKDE